MESSLRSPGRHEFTVRHGADELHCVAYAVNNDLEHPYYCVFRNCRLDRIVEWFPWPYVLTKFPPDLPPDGSVYPVPVPWRVEDRIDQTLSAPDLPGAELLESARRHMVEDNVRPAYIISSILCPLLLVRRVSDDIEAQRIEQHFDPPPVRIGMSRQEVDSALGPPWGVRRNAANRELRIYGHMLDADENTRYSWRSARIIAEFDHGRVTAIYGNDFIHPDWLAPVAPTPTDSKPP